MKKNTIIRWLTMYILMAVVEKVGEDNYNITSLKYNSEEAEKNHIEEWSKASEGIESNEMDPSDMMKDLISMDEFMKNFDPEEAEKISINGNSVILENYLSNLTVGEKVYVLTEDNKEFTFTK